jgi:hypothetical protein
MTFSRILNLIKLFKNLDVYLAAVSMAACTNGLIECFFYLTLLMLLYGSNSKMLFIIMYS